MSARTCARIPAVDLPFDLPVRANLYALPGHLATLRAYSPGCFCLFVHTESFARTPVIFSARVRLSAYADTPKRSDLYACADMHMLVPAYTHSTLPPPGCFRALVDLRTRSLLPPRTSLCTRASLCTHSSLPMPAVQSAYPVTLPSSSPFRALTANIQYPFDLLVFPGLLAPVNPRMLVGLRALSGPHSPTISRASIVLRAPASLPPILDLFAFDIIPTHA
eukprot:1174388-Pleurochrysis_carterae.AAC.2